MKQYPRYFINVLSEKDSGDPFIYKLNKPDDIIVNWGIINMNPINTLIFKAHFNKQMCEKRVADGDWREVPYSEIALIF